MKGDRAAAIVCKDGKILLIERNKEGVFFYVLPGGHIEEGETVEAAVVRELKEETTIKAKLGNSLGSFSHNGRTHYTYECEYISGTPKLHTDSPEADVVQSEGNTYVPMWVDVKKVADLPMWPEQIKSFLLDYFKS